MVYVILLLYFSMSFPFSLVLLPLNNMQPHSSVRKPDESEHIRKILVAVPCLAEVMAIDINGNYACVEEEYGPFT